MIKYKESDDNFDEIKQKYGNMTQEEIKKVLKEEEDRIKKIKEMKKTNNDEQSL